MDSYRNETQVSSANHQLCSSTNHAARHYVGLGYRPVAYAYGTKGPTDKGWNELRVVAEAVEPGIVANRHPRTVFHTA